MKKIVFSIAMAGLFFSAAQGQMRKVEKSEVKKTNPVLIKTIPEEPKAPPPPVTNKTTGTENQFVPVYTLTSVRVNIRTGNDNKEFPSNVIVWYQAKNTPRGSASAFSQFSLSNEMRINTDTEFGLQKNATGELKLDAFQANGSVLCIRYSPNFFADAWKIEGVSVVLEFKDQNGNLHPSLGSKTITFTNAYGFLNGTYEMMECAVDGSFAPLTASIRKAQ